MRGTRRSQVNEALRTAFDTEWQQAEEARRAGRWHEAFGRLERAHILGQQHTGRHVITHLAMLRVGWQRGDVKEVLGQLPRVLAALLFSRLWVPIGNTGGARVNAFTSMPVPTDLRTLLTLTEREP